MYPAGRNILKVLLASSVKSHIIGTPKQSCPQCEIFRKVDGILNVIVSNFFNSQQKCKNISLPVVCESFSA